MMKRYKIVLSFICSLFILTGCSDQFLKNMGPGNGTIEVGMWADESYVTMFVDRIYGAMYGNAMPKNYDATVPGDYNNLTEEHGVGSSYTGMVNPLYLFDYNNNIDTYYGTQIQSSIQYSDVWTRIRAMNDLLENIDTYGAEMAYNTRQRFKGEMFFWRAYQYYRLWVIYGGVPVVLEVQDAIGAEKDGDLLDSSVALPRSSATVVYDQIIADLDSAVMNLETQYSDSNWGRITSGAAAAMKGRVMLYWASPVFNRDWETERWTKAYTYMRDTALPLLSSGGYDLTGESNPGTRGSAWANMFTTDAPAEAIIPVIYSTSSALDVYNTWENSLRPSVLGGGGGKSATLEIMEKFPMSDGSRPGENTSTSQGPVYDRNYFFADRDPRFYRTFAFNGVWWPTSESNGEGTLWTYNWYDEADIDYNEDPYGTNSTPSLSTYTSPVSSGIWVKKASYDDAIDPENFSKTGLNYFEFRYAEFLLNLAEAATGANDLTEAYNILTRIRKRAGLPASNNYGLKASASAYTQQEMFEAILYERSIELAYEGKRYYDIHRWMLFDGGVGQSAIDPSNPLASPSIGNTCTWLGVEPLNGTRRTGLYLIAAQKDAQGRKLPLSSDESGDDGDYLKQNGLLPAFDGTIDPNVGRVDPDASDEVWEAGIESLKKFYEDHIIVRYRPDAVDGTVESFPYIYYRPYAYFQGMSRSLLSKNSWLQQTVGYKDINNVDGTFIPYK